MPIRVATLNAGLVQIKAAGRIFFEFAPFVDDRSEALPKFLLTLDADCIFLQEVFNESHWNALVAQLSKDYPHVYRASKRRHHLFDLGLGLLSRFPIKSAHSYSFSSQLTDELLVAPRGMQIVAIEIADEKSILVANCHTTAGGIFSHPESTRADSCRADQLQQLVAKCSALNQSATLVVGDLNCGPEASSSNYEFMVGEAGYRDLVADLYKQLGVARAPVTWDPANLLNVDSPHKSSPPQRIDHIMYRSKSGTSISLNGGALIGANFFVDVAEGQAVTVSDHYGYLLSFSIG